MKQKVMMGKQYTSEKQPPNIISTPNLINLTPPNVPNIISSPNLINLAPSNVLPPNTISSPNLINLTPSNVLPPNSINPPNLIILAPSDKITVHIGNMHKQVDEHNHEWKVYVRGDVTLIDRVCFKLHPTFQPSTITVNCDPFEVDRVGWGVFTVPITIYFKNGKEKQFDHNLDFASDNICQTYSFNI